ncbi:tRNA uridine-5-carboxymethylaminomethyl(34) synthesis enzyme MnmG [Candidatus Babeliales bacterium]|nr:tRNA uridine-5-carboxymethylaminomethyl(34) synthesis enzyme MnmG [Candidatus Babeliales bacterium]
MNTQFDVIVIGGGHAGVEAAYAAAKMGSKTALVTLDANKIATMPCNPSIGGLGKGHIVYEVSALGGLMPQLASKTYLQARMLNTSKGPAVQGLRLQIDKYAYSRAAKEMLSQVKNLTIVSIMAQEIMTEDVDGKRRITGVRAADGTELTAPCVVVTTGTFMSGLVHIGLTRYKAGRRGEAASYGLSESIAHAMGVKVGRLKTGTPPRIERASIDFSKLEEQPPQKLDYLYQFEHEEVVDQMPCYIAQTNETTHQHIRDNLHLSAMYSGNIKGRGPRYCPSIEDKIGRFPDKNTHHVFVEPESKEVDEIYPAGLSTSLPLDVQEAYIRSMEGFENAVISKCGYAIEYDFIQPNNLTHALEAKTVEGLFLAGQLNGTTGYEEAAGQGIIAGINAHLRRTGQPPFILNRHESYIGVMIDDMVTLGVDEPYRMFTSRAERRLLLRQDNVFLRIMPYAHKLGLIDNELFARFQAERDVIKKSVSLIRGAGSTSQLFKAFQVVEFTDAAQAHARALLEYALQEKEIPSAALSSRALLGVHAEIRYEGYLRKEELEVEKALRYQGLEIPTALDFRKISGLNAEMQEKLVRYQPKNIAQAQLIPGITPAAISLLIFSVRKG